MMISSGRGKTAAHLAVGILLALATTSSAARADDHGDFWWNATPIGIGSSVFGDIETNGDVDYFSFLATAGTMYTLETTLVTLGDSVLDLYDTNGSTWLTWDDDSGVGLASLIIWTCPASGTYYVDVWGWSLTGIRATAIR